MPEVKLTDWQIKNLAMVNHNAMLLARQHKRTLNKNDIVELGIMFDIWTISF